MKLADFITRILDHGTSQKEVLYRELKIEGKKQYRIRSVNLTDKEIIIKIGDKE